jgi:hypothetical protein
MRSDDACLLSAMPELDNLDYDEGDACRRKGEITLAQSHASVIEKCIASLTGNMHDGETQPGLLGDLLPVPLPSPLPCRAEKC